MQSPRTDDSPPPPSRPRLAVGVRLRADDDGAFLLEAGGERLRLNLTAREILARCDGSRDLAQLINDLELVFETRGIADEVRDFVDIAAGRGWLE